MSYEVYAIYCDDVRQEAGGKISTMGIYSGSMFLPGFPFTMRQLYAVVIFTCAPEEYPKQLTVQFTLESKLLTSTDFALPPPPNILDTPFNPDPDEPSKIGLQTIIYMQDITFKTPCRLRLRVIADGIEARGPGIYVLPPNDQPLPATAAQA